MVQAGDDKTCFPQFAAYASLYAPNMAPKWYCSAAFVVIIINTSIQIVCIMGIQGLKVAQGLP